ncbi:hypothetical protein ACTXT7_016925 [Hymenolepis weldensis]
MLAYNQNSNCRGYLHCILLVQYFVHMDDFCTECVSHLRTPYAILEIQKVELLMVENCNFLILNILLRLPSPTRFESESDCKLASEQLVFVDVLHSSDYCFHERGGFGVMGSLINFQFNRAPPRPTHNNRKD